MGKKDVFSEVAKKYNTTSDDVKNEIQEAINIASQNEDPEIRKFWESIPKEGDVATPEEAISFIADIIKKRHNMS